MKTILLITVSLISLITLAYVAPYFFTTHTTAVSVMIDKTDSFLIQPSARQIHLALNLDGDKWQSVDLRITMVSNVDYNTVDELYLPGRRMLFSNPGARDHEIASFNQHATTVIDSVNRQPNGLPKTSVYVPLIRECNRLAAITADRKIAVYYGDFFENTLSGWSIYSKRDRELLKTAPEKVQQLFKTFAQPADLHGVIVYFIFKPKSAMENDYYKSMSALFSSLLEAAGATVYIDATIPATIH